MSYPIIILLGTGFMFIAYILAKKFNSPTAKGKFGEFMIKNVSFLRLPRNTYTTLNDVTIPDNQGGTTQIDHVVISKYGIFVIETKNYNGWIFGAENQRQWTQVHYKQKHQFQNPVRQNYKHTETLRQHLGLSSEEIFSVVAFVGDAEFKKGTKPDNVFMNGGSAIAYIKSKGIEYFSEETCLKIKQDIEQLALENTREVRKKHINYVQNKKNGFDLEDVLASETSSNPPACNKCGSQMVKRTAKNGANAGNQFWGCSTYPKCRNIMKI
jgi:restriction system protein